MGDHLTALDATFLELEQADDSAHMHIGGILVFDPIPGGGAPTPEQLCAHLESRLHSLPRYSQRLSQPRTGGLSWPEWREDPTFELSRHITRAALPAPGGSRELQDWVSGFFSQRLDRHRPLWEMVIVEGLEGGGWALATKTHHCMVDGVGSVDVGHLILDASPEPPAKTAGRRITKRSRGANAPGAGEGDGAGSGPVQPAKQGRTLPAPLASLARAWEGLVPSESLSQLAQMSVHGMLHPREALSSARDVAEVIVRDELNAAPGTSLNEPIGTRRRLEAVRVQLADMKEIKNALGGTVNDVALAITASGVRELLLSRGEALPAHGLRAMVPMNIRTASERLALGNKVSSLFVELPVEDADPLARYQDTVARSKRLKDDGHQAAGTSTMIGLTALAPPVLHATIAQALYAKRLFNLTITNVPGPQQTLYAFGAPLREIQPLVPLAADHAVGVAVMSYDGAVCFGVAADPDAVPDLDVMLAGMQESADALLACAHAAVA
jgi:WS/DGAT/MGAT family acyltransferase